MPQTDFDRLKDTLANMPALDKALLDAMIQAYNAVWASYTPIDAKTITHCRLLAMTAALEAQRNFDQRGTE